MESRDKNRQSFHRGWYVRHSKYPKGYEPLDKDFVFVYTQKGRPMMSSKDGHFSIHPHCKFSEYLEPLEMNDDKTDRFLQRVAIRLETTANRIIIDSHSSLDHKKQDYLSLASFLKRRLAEPIIDTFVPEFQRKTVPVANGTAA